MLRFSARWPPYFSDVAISGSVRVVQFGNSFFLLMVSVAIVFLVLAIVQRWIATPFVPYYNVLEKISIVWVVVSMVIACRKRCFEMDLMSGQTATWLSFFGVSGQKHHAETLPIAIRPLILVRLGLSLSTWNGWCAMIRMNDKLYCVACALTENEVLQWYNNKLYDVCGDCDRGDEIVRSWY